MKTGEKMRLQVQTNEKGESSTVRYNSNETGVKMGNSC